MKTNGTPGTPQGMEAYAVKRRARKKWRRLVICLAALVVIATTSALVVPAVTLDSSGPYCGETAHQHISTCFDEDGNLVCDLSEHTHTLACYSDDTADVETAEDWEATVKGVELTGNYALDLLQIAKTQLGYEESTRNYIVVDEDEETAGSGYGSATTGDALESETDDTEGETENGTAEAVTENATEAAQTETRAAVTEAQTEAETAVTGASTEAAEPATESETEVSAGDTTEETTEDATEETTEETAEETADETTGETENSVPEDDLSGLGLYHSAASGYTAQPGDLVFFDFDGDGASDHVGIVAGYSDSSVTGSAAEKVLTAAIKSLQAAVENGEDAETETGSYLVTVEGNSDDKVQMVSYAVGSSDILGYGQMAENEEITLLGSSANDGIALIDDESDGTWPEQSDGATFTFTVTPYEYYDDYELGDPLEPDTDTGLYPIKQKINNADAVYYIKFTAEVNYLAEGTYYYQLPTQFTYKEKTSYYNLDGSKASEETGYDIKMTVSETGLVTIYVVNGGSEVTLFYEEDWTSTYALDPYEGDEGDSYPSAYKEMLTNKNDLEENDYIATFQVTLNQIHYNYGSGSIVMTDTMTNLAYVLGSMKIVATDTGTNLKEGTDYSVSFDSSKSELTVTIYIMRGTRSIYLPMTLI